MIVKSNPKFKTFPSKFTPPVRCRWTTQVQHITHGLGRRSENDVLSGQPDTLQGEDERKAFLREVNAMTRLRNPHIVDVFGAITSLPDRLVLVMELLAGGDLRNVLKISEQPLSEEKSRQIIQDVCRGMGFLHGKGMVHGDLKSANILLDGGGRAKVRRACGVKLSYAYRRFIIPRHFRLLAVL